MPSAEPPPERSSAGQSSTPGDWPAPTPRGPIEASVVLPGSKSLTNRYLVLAALAEDTSRLRRPLRSRDTLLMAEALRALGATISDLPTADGPDPDWLIEPGPVRGGAQIDCGLAGTVMRFLPAVAALAEEPVRFDGDEHARVRPMSALLQALRTIGAEVADSGSGTLPFTVGGGPRLRGGPVTMDASASSQYISALLLAGARYPEGIRVSHDGPPVPSQPHIDMTVETLRDVGADVDDSEPNTWSVAPGSLGALDVTVEPDLSNAAPFLAAAAVAGGRVSVPGWPGYTTQAGDAIRDILDAMGVDVHLDRDRLEVRGDGHLEGIDVNLHDAAELTPVVAALAAVAASPTWIRGVAHIRGHETDRLAALRTELSALGSDVAETDDGLHIRPSRLQPGRFRTYADHRMVMAAAVLGLAVPGIVVEDAATVAKTLPTFTTLWESMLEQHPSTSS
ncbi:MAG: 3-phosphoshikimate 1-carboxyvinyltransferase [Actinomycetia bacterium]|nr:3-phosphoshikimate 1-carboxyvinyltransferase [Actinomycetes bacterium]